MSRLEAIRNAERAFGQEVAIHRKRLGISQEELGFRAQVHRTYVSQIERGLKSPSLSIILKLSRALGVTAAQLISAVERRA